jgi:hypothetical protein
LGTLTGGGERTGDHSPLDGSGQLHSDSQAMGYGSAEGIARSGGIHG